MQKDTGLREPDKLFWIFVGIHVWTKLIQSTLNMLVVVINYLVEYICMPLKLRTR